MLQITFSNRVESLLDNLLTSLKSSPSSVFRTDQIIIPSAAMRRKVDLAITDRFGICANVRFSFLAQWIWEQIGILLPDHRTAPLTPAVLAWRIVKIFDDQSFVSTHPRLKTYLSVADPVMRFDLATRVAALLEQYATYRPAWAEQWSKGLPVDLQDANAAQIEDEAWQSALWQRVVSDIGAARQHLTPQILHELKAAIDNSDRQPATTPIHLFCLPTIPPVHLEALRELGRAHELVQLYVINPCREYWFDIVDRKRLSYLAMGGDLQHHDVGNRLLGAWGKQTQAQIDLLLDADISSIIDEAFDEAAPSRTLLAQVQNAVLDLVELTPASITLQAGDRSIEFHACHSLTRELEVLQDQLLALLEQSDAPLPCDILVVTPDLEHAAALIDTVFGSTPLNRRIPYTITGRPASTANPAASALLGLLTLATSRITASGVFALLQQPIISRRFGFGQTELDVIHSWLGLSGIRWGIDSTGSGSSEIAPCSFESGLHRLFLGYALPATVKQPFNARVPAANIEGGESLILGRFWHAMQCIGDLQRKLCQPYAAAAWLPLLDQVLATFFEPDNDQLDHLQQVHASLRLLHEQLRHADFDGLIEQDVMRTALAALLDESARGGVPTGSVTFAGMSSLRNLPYRVLCAIGLNDGAFPTINRPPEFDLMPVAPRAGDRQRRIDDRNLFLDLILSARDRLYLSFTGRGVRDNAPMPPSVLVADLLDYLVPAIATDANNSTSLKNARARLLVTHPLQPFSIRYFIAGDDARLSSANEEYCGALKHALAQAPAAAKSGDVRATDSADAEGDSDNSNDDADVAAVVHAFFATPLPAPDEAWRTVSVDQLKSFFSNPCRYLLKNRLGLRIQEVDETLQDDEPFLPDWAGLKALAERMLPLFEQGLPIAQIEAMATAGIELPPGPMGKAALDAALHSMHAFSSEVQRVSAEPCVPPHQVNLAFDLDGETWRLTGGFSDVRLTGLVRSRYDAVRAVDYLNGWIDHLALNATLPAGVTGTTTWISRDGDYALSPCDNAHAVLDGLLRLYRQGLAAPLHFYPKSAWKYVIKEHNMTEASKTWFSSTYNEHGEDQHPAYRLALRGIDDPLDAAFEHAARIVFDPMQHYLEDDRL